MLKLATIPGRFCELPPTEAVYLWYGNLLTPTKELYKNLNVQKYFRTGTKFRPFNIIGLICGWCACACSLTKS